MRGLSGRNGRYDYRPRATTFPWQQQEVEVDEVAVVDRGSGGIHTHVPVGFMYVPVQGAEHMRMRWVRRFVRWLSLVRLFPGDTDTHTLTRDASRGALRYYIRGVIMLCKLNIVSQLCFTWICHCCCFVAVSLRDAFVSVSFRGVFSSPLATCGSDKYVYAVPAFRITLAKNVCVSRKSAICFVNCRCYKTIKLTSNLGRINFVPHWLYKNYLHEREHFFITAAHCKTYHNSNFLLNSSIENNILCYFYSLFFFFLPFIY